MGRIWQIACFLVLALPAFAAGGSCPSGTYSIQGSTGTLTALGVTSCYFVSQSTGSDTNAGTTEASPWAHMPEMPSCTSSCSSATIAAGTGIILRGGEVWAASDLGITWTHSGTASHPNYIGVDPTWYNATNCGASWCRPVFNPAGSAMTGSYYIFLNNGSTAIWTTVDNIEEKGWSCAAMESGTMNSMISPDAEYEHMYVHGWSYSQPNTTCQVYAFGANASDGTSQVQNSYFHHNVVDGSDQSPAPYTGGTSITCSSTAGCIPVGCVLHADIFANNVCNFVYNVNGLFDQLYGNLFENFVTGNSGDHCNMTNMQGIFIGSVGLAYNNIYTSTYCGGGLVLWLSGNTASSSAQYYAFNNVFYNLAAGSNQLITTCTHPAQGTQCGLFFIWNNTASSSGQQLAGNGECATAVNSFTGTSGTLTFATATQGAACTAFTFLSGNWVLLSGFGGSNTGLNGQTVQVLSGGLSSTSFEAVVSGSGYSSGSGTVSGPLKGEVYLANNHLIGTTTLCEEIGVFCFDQGNELSQTAAQADANSSPHFDQYTSSQTYVYSPVASTNSTVGAGQNISSNINSWCSGNNPMGFTCPSISFTGNLAAALSDTTYASENTTNHTVLMRTVNARGSTWDIGAYQFSGGTNYTLTVTVSGSGSVSSSPSGISCPSTCSASYSSGTVVTLTETPSGGYTFTGWSGGGCSGAATTCVVTMSAAESVTATFTASSSYTLSVTVTGSGSVSSSPIGINCPGTCSVGFTGSVTLTAAPSGSYVFSGWYGGGCSGTLPCTVNVTTALSIKAVFAQTGTTSLLTQNLTATSTSYSIASNIVTIAATNTFGANAWIGLSGFTHGTQLNGQVLLTNVSTTGSQVVGTLYTVQKVAQTLSNVSTTADTTGYLQGQGWNPFVTAPFPLCNGSPSCVVTPTVGTWAYDFSIPGPGPDNAPTSPIVAIADYGVSATSLSVSASGESYDHEISLPDGSGNYMYCLVNQGRCDIFSGHIDSSVCNNVPCFVPDVVLDSKAWNHTPINYGAFSRNLTKRPGTNKALWYSLYESTPYASPFWLKSDVLSYSANQVTSTLTTNLYDISTCPGFGYVTIGTGLAFSGALITDNFDDKVEFILGSGTQGGPGRHMQFIVSLTNGTCETLDTDGMTGTAVYTYGVTASHGGTAYTNGDTITGAYGDTYTATVSGGVVTALTQVLAGTGASLSQGNATTGGTGTGLEYDITGIGTIGTYATLYAPISSASCPAGTTLTCEAPITTGIYTFGIHAGGMLSNGQYTWLSGWGTSGQPGQCTGCDYVIWSVGNSPTLTGTTSGNQNGHPSGGFNWLGTASNPNYYLNRFLGAISDPTCANLSDCQLLYTLPSGGTGGNCSVSPGGSQMHSAVSTILNDDSLPILVTSSINTPGTPTQTNPPNFTCGLGQNSLFSIAKTGGTTWYAHHYENGNNHAGEQFEGTDTICTESPDAVFAICDEDMNYGFAGNTGLATSLTSAAEPFSFMLNMGIPVIPYPSPMFGFF